jgi:hypothetical protein
MRHCETLKNTSMQICTHKTYLAAIFLGESREIMLQSINHSPLVGFYGSGIIVIIAADTTGITGRSCVILLPTLIPTLGHLSFGGGGCGENG